MTRKKSDSHKKRKEVSLRLLESGLRFFALRGYEGATVREICDDSGSNLAAINYYFKDKRGFYSEVCAYAHRLLRSKFNSLCKEAKDTDAWQQLKNHVRAMVESAYDDKLLHASWLYMREVMTPIDLDNPEQGQSDEDYQAQEAQNWQMMSDLLGPAATHENIVLLHYTFVSLSVFMIIQHHVAVMSRRPTRFAVNALLDKEHLQDYIITVMETTVARMRERAADSPVTTPPPLPDLPAHLPPIFPDKTDVSRLLP